MTAARPLSLIIPIGPAEAALPRLIRNETALPDTWQRLLAIGEHDQRFDAPGWESVSGSWGRGRQLNQAATRALGEWLWFQHADSLPDATAIRSIAPFMTQWSNSETLGYCRLRFDVDGPTLVHLNAIGANLRSRCLHLPYGDQGLLIRKAVFERLGGFREDLARGEDLDFIVRAKDAGVRIQPIGGTVSTSARRYAERGWLRTTIEHQRASVALVRGARELN
ncbi:MAG: glycosyl transferase family 2 [Pseudomonadota bacterium]